MKDLDRDLDSLYEWVLGMLGFVLFLTFIWMNRHRWSDYKETQKKSSTRCNSPNCIRCHSLCTPSLTLVRQRFYEFCGKASSMSESHAAISRVESLINSALTKRLIHRSIFAESGYMYDVENKAESLPHVWMLPGLARHTFWSDDFHPSLQDVVVSSEDPELVRAIENEFRVVDRGMQGWKLNSVPSGKWKVFCLYSQGKINEENCAKCPRTMHLLSTIKLAMQDHTFGNAIFSVLNPGSCIEPHIGPCNYRLRCHLPLIVPSGYTMKVGRDTSVWQKGKLMIFDDSFVHEVWSESAEGSDMEYDKGRAVLIFDIWHPQVTSLEKAAIKHIFD